MESARLLDTILKKKWLSSNTVRDGLIACFTVILTSYAKNAALSALGLEVDGAAGDSPDETSVYRVVLQACQDSFRAMQIDDEYPTKDQIFQLKALMEDRLGMSKLAATNQELMEEYRNLTRALLEKMG